MVIWLCENRNQRDIVHSWWNKSPANTKTLFLLVIFRSPFYSVAMWWVQNMHQALEIYLYVIRIHIIWKRCGKYKLNWLYEEWADDCPQTNITLHLWILHCMDLHLIIYKWNLSDKTAKYTSNLWTHNKIKRYPTVNPKTIDLLIWMFYVMKFSRESTPLVIQILYRESISQGKLQQSKGCS